MIYLLYHRLTVIARENADLMLFSHEKSNYSAYPKTNFNSGGISYESTGSTGDGYRFAEEFGLKVTE